jgi:hypothetical protein
MKPLRNESETIRCALCDHCFPRNGRQRSCDGACRQAAWRRRHAQPQVPVIPTRIARLATAYVCTECDTRYLSEQRCPDCQRFCKRVGPGGPCPHCDEPVAVADLIA